MIERPVDRYMIPMCYELGRASFKANQESLQAPPAFQKPEWQLAWERGVRAGAAQARRAETLKQQGDASRKTTHRRDRS
jgi:hypothetical protein